ncbi:MAG: hypothetical protein IH627_22825 [Rubrivivax sp.]|nr:hypothetical protein [Rubrivivax sp.]
MSRIHVATQVPTTGPRPPAAMSLLGLPFDTMRALHATGVQAGLIRRSMLDSRDFERMLGAAERFMLGPLARNA